MTAIPDTTLSEMIENVLVAAEAVHEEEQTSETALVVAKLKEAQTLAERAEGSHHGGS